MRAAAPAAGGDALAAFEPGIRHWFADTFPGPTDIQSASWPVIARGEHVLVTAPTGSGKTLTAFLWSLNRFAAGRSEPGRTRVLYVSPLKALNNDIQRNLLQPLEALTARGVLPGVRVQTRSGDTPQSERQRMLRRPPEILVTTPESLALLLTTARGRLALAGVETVILDEVHALVANRRGTLLLTGLERLAALAGEFQRVALSATVTPLEPIAAYLGGRDALGQPRAVRVIDAPNDKSVELRVRFPEAAQHAADAGQKIWEPLAAAFREHIARNRATLFFTNSRRLSEVLAARINEGQQRPLAYAHHGSLSREIRLQVEQRLKAGELPAIVATSSLEMGIDIGDLDEVVLIQSPPAVAAALQRIGRAGHNVGEVSRGTLYPTHAQDFVEAAALTAAVAARDIEPLAPLHNPLDVLAQIIVSMTASEPWPVDAIYRLLLQSGPYQHLPREQFDLVVEMLAGRFSGSRVRELKPRLSYDRIKGVVKASPGAVLALYNAGGVIPDRGYYQLRRLDGGGKIGELDEEFVWESTVGQVFTLGNQNWQIHRITHNDVLVKPTTRPPTVPAFWRSDAQNRSFHFSVRIAAFLTDAEHALAANRASALHDRLIDEHAFDETAADELVGYLRRQREHTGAPLPHGRHLLLEQVRTGPGGYHGPNDAQQLVIHSLWGGQVNRPWGQALKAALVRLDLAPDVHADDDALVIQTRSPIAPLDVLALVTPDNFDTLLRETLEGSGFFGGRFREAAGRSLLLSRQRFNQRLPLWMSRLQAKRLLAEVQDYADFPVLLETWRTCLGDEFDLPAVKRCLTDIESGEVAATAVVTASPSPFAAHLTFGQVSRYMYADDRPDQPRRSALSDELIKSALTDPSLRPRLAVETVEAFVAKRQRTAPGYRPETEDEWLDWIKERVLVPADEIAPGFDHPYLVHASQDDRHWLTHRELLAALLGSELGAGLQAEGPVPEVDDPRDGRQLALDVLSYYGPLTADAVAARLPSVPEGLLDDEQLVSGALLEGDERVHYCDVDNYQALLRLQRSRNRPQLEPHSASALPGYLAAWQGLGRSASLEDALEPLRGYRAPIGVWLEDLLAARCAAFVDHQLDQAADELGLAWTGAGKGQIRIGYPEDLALLQPAAGPGRERADLAELFVDPDAGYSFVQLAERQPAPLATFNERWWEAVWAGAVTADTLAPLRQGAARDFKLAHAAGVQRPSRRHGQRAARGFARSAWANPWTGHWRLAPPVEAADDALVALDDAKERARLLLDRYGLVCREVANREGEPLRWSDVFRALRIMELAGEVVAGYFFDGLSGPQFAPPGALAALHNPAPPGTFWVSALDPASPCGLGLDALELPQRRAGNYLCFHDGALALVVENRGRRLRFAVAPEHPEIQPITAPVAHLLVRHRRLELETINDRPAAGSPYLAVLGAIGRIVTDHRHTFLEAL